MRAIGREAKEESADVMECAAAMRLALRHTDGLIRAWLSYKLAQLASVLETDPSIVALVQRSDVSVKQRAQESFTLDGLTECIRVQILAWLGQTEREDNPEMDVNTNVDTAVEK